jgi:hypothetical protein
MPIPVLFWKNSGKTLEKLIANLTIENFRIGDSGISGIIPEKSLIFLE